MRKLTETQAWYKVAEKLADRTYRFDAGLCWELRRLYMEDAITHTQYKKMQMHCQSYIVPEEAWYNHWAYPRGRERKARILAALFFAEMA